jgi:LDH2 family malate/lactate/ureidoglycolate dehydrogenase
VHLTDNSRIGFFSHGLPRLPQYVRRVQAGAVDPTATPVVEVRTGAKVVIDAQRAFGQVAAGLAVEEAVAGAQRHEVSCVLVHDTAHVGRLGAYTEQVARHGCVAIGFLSGTRDLHRVAPFGAREARLATNPISFAFPTTDEPVVSDFATSVRAEGFVRNQLSQGLSVPDGVLRDAAGNPTTDPAVLYAEPCGTLQPLGGDQGYKGFALALLAEVMATLLVGGDTLDWDRYGNNLGLVAIRPAGDFATRATALTDYIRSAAPLRGGDEVLLPGDLERRARARTSMVQVDAQTWAELGALASELGVGRPDATDHEEAS